MSGIMPSGLPRAKEGCRYGGDYVTGNTRYPNVRCPIDGRWCLKYTVDVTQGTAKLENPHDECLVEKERTQNP